MSGHRRWDLVRDELHRRQAAQLRWADEVARRDDPDLPDPPDRPTPLTTAAHDHAYEARLDAASPAFERDYLLARVWSTRWRAVPDDLVGGWAVVAACDRVTATSELDLPAGERAVCDGVLSRGLAAHVAELHNAALDALPALPEDLADRDDLEEHS